MGAGALISFLSQGLRKDAFWLSSVAKLSLADQLAAPNPCTPKADNALARQRPRSPSSHSCCAHTARCPGARASSPAAHPLHQTGFRLLQVKEVIVTRGRRQPRRAGAVTTECTAIEIGQTPGAEQPATVLANPGVGPDLPEGAGRDRLPDAVLQAPSRHQDAAIARDG